MIWTISDLHLSSVHPKPMDIFGPHWKDHAQRIAAAWQQRVRPEDWVLIAGDISWALKLADALPDLAWIDALPGRKVMIRGNHDYWYPRRVGPLRAQLPPSISALGGDAMTIDAIDSDAIDSTDGADGTDGTEGANKSRGNDRAVVCGTRGWITPDTPGFQPASDQRIYERELGLLDRALEAGRALAGETLPLIVMIHYPPFLDRQPTAFAQRIAAAGAAACIYGHLHRSADWQNAVQGVVDGVSYQLTACDYLGFGPVAVRGLRAPETG
jgi:hypothetical protein